MDEVMVECVHCDGTGLWCKGDGRIAVICSFCNGSGAKPAKMFNGRKFLKDVETVKISESQEITYRDFLRG